MKNVFKIVFTLILSITIANVAYGVGAPGLQQGFNTSNYGNYIDVSTQSPLVFIGTVLQSVLTLMGAVAVVMIIYAGVIISSSKGDEAKYKSGKKTILMAVLGLVIIIISWSIVYWVTGANSFLWTSQQQI